MLSVQPKGTTPWTKCTNIKNAYRETPHWHIAASDQVPLLSTTKVKWVFSNINLRQVTGSNSGHRGVKLLKCETTSHNLLKLIPDLLRAVNSTA